MFTMDARGKSKNSTVKIAAAILALLFIVVLGPGLLNIGTGQALAHDDRGDRWDYKRPYKVNACTQTTDAALTACQLAAQEDYNLALGNCYNVSDSEERKECLKEAKNDLKDATGECRDQREARQEVCRELGGGPYDPDIDPENFVNSDMELKGNAYFPLTPGTYKYQSIDPDNNEILETIVVTVTNKITIIDGIKCREVTDRATEGDKTFEDGGRLLEDTIDWYAQDNEGNVWYFGETTIAYDYDEYGNPIASTEGSWMAGLDEAKPGFIMLADPGTQIGKLYRQEFSLGTAEDLGQVIEMVDDLPALPSGVSLPAEVQGPYLHTQDSTPLEPGVIEDKYYAPGVGLVLTIEPEATEVLIKIE